MPPYPADRCVGSSTYATSNAAISLFNNALNCRYHGRGIVMTAGGLRYFTSAYVNIRVIRHFHKCTLPIEVFYAGADEMPQSAVSFMQMAFADVTFIDIYSVKGSPAAGSIHGYALKPYPLLYSSFEEVLFVDSDSFPLEDPTNVFDIPQYVSTGALFWPDICNYYSTRIEAWDLFELARPEWWPDIQTGGTDYWMYNSNCDGRAPPEVESGQIVMDKRRAWHGLLMTTFINLHADYFIGKIMHDDKQTWPFAFQATHTRYHLVEKPHIGFGRAAQQRDGWWYMCHSTYGQRHPETGEVLFMHRSNTKFVHLGAFLSMKPVLHAWTHESKQGPFEVVLMNFQCSQLCFHCDAC